MLFLSKYVNDLSGRIDLDKTLEHAEGLYLQLSNFKSLPVNICEILGIPTNEKLLKDDFEDEKLIKMEDFQSLAISSKGIAQLQSKINANEAAASQP